MIAPRDSNTSVSTEGFHTFFGAYCAYREECAEIGRSWNADTQEQYENIIIRLVVPNLRKHNSTPIRDYRREDYLKVIHLIEQAGKNNDPSNPDPYEEGTLDKILHIIKTVVKVASEKESFRNVFEEDAQEGPQEDRISRMRTLWMTPKSFSVKQEYAVAEYIFSNLNNRGELIALFLMYALGLRNGEACGADYGNIRRMKDYPIYYLMIPQTTKPGTNETQVGGKTYNTARNIPLPDYAVKVLFRLREERLAQLRKDPYRDESEIDTLPIAHHKGKAFIRCNSDNVSAEAKKMFEKLGMRDNVDRISQFLQQEFSAAKEEQADMDDYALLEENPTAYLLRRNFATHLSILGLNDAEISYIMGHVIEDHQTKRSDFLDERDLYKIAEKLNKRPILNEITKQYLMALEGNSTVRFDGYRQVFMVPANANRVQLSASAKEPTDSVSVKIKLTEEPAEARVETAVRGIPYPHHFENSVNVLKTYHASFHKHAPDRT